MFNYHICIANPVSKNEKKYSHEVNIVMSFMFLLGVYLYLEIVNKIDSNRNGLSDQFKLIDFMYFINLTKMIDY